MRRREIARCVTVHPSVLDEQPPVCQPRHRARGRCRCFRLVTLVGQWWANNTPMVALTRSAQPCVPAGASCQCSPGCLGHWQTREASQHPALSSLCDVPSSPVLLRSRACTTRTWLVHWCSEVLWALAMGLGRLSVTTSPCRSRFVRRAGGVYRPSRRIAVCQ